MNKFKLLAVLLSIFLLASCSNTAVQQPEDGTAAVESTVSDANAVTESMITYEPEDEYSEWQSQNPNYIELAGASAAVKGTGAEVDGSRILITAAGTYAISGKLDDGQIVVDTQDKGTVRLVLNGAEIHSAKSAPIYIKNAGKAVISLQEGTVNTLSDGETYVYDDPGEEEPSGAIFSKDNLTVNGTGTLNIKANFNDGITGKDELRITGGIIQIDSKDDGIVGKDMILAKGGTVTIHAGGDGMKATNDTDASKGFIALQGGSFDIKAAADGIQAETSVLITDGVYGITTGGGSANSSPKVEAGRQGFWGNPGSTETAQSDEEKQSAKGIKASADITIAGGTFAIDSADDGIHSNNSINLTGGDISIASGDDGIHADTSIAIKDGKVNITKSYEGIESANISISGGEIHVVAGDDGINISGGNDGSSVNGRPGQNEFAVLENSKLDISGGYIVVNASGDGLDSNGSIVMTGGTVVVNGPTSSGNGAVDYNGTFEISGGFLVAAGSAGMSQAVSESSTQYTINMTFSTGQGAGTLFHLRDSSGKAIVTFAPEKAYQTVLISSPELKKDAAYTVYAGGSSTGSEANGFYTGGTYSGGTEMVSVTLSQPVTWLSETGVTQGNGSFPGGGQRPGGFQGGEQRPEGFTRPESGGPQGGGGGMRTPQNQPQTQPQTQ